MRNADLLIYIYIYFKKSLNSVQLLDTKERRALYTDSNVQLPERRKTNPHVHRDIFLFFSFIFFPFLFFCKIFSNFSLWGEGVGVEVELIGIVKPPLFFVII